MSKTYLIAEYFDKYDVLILWSFVKERNCHTANVRLMMQRDLFFDYLSLLTYNEFFCMQFCKNKKEKLLKLKCTRFKYSNYY